MPFYRKRPVVIEAVQWRGDNEDEMLEWMGEEFYVREPYVGELTGNAYTAVIWVNANTNWLNIVTGEWVIKDSLGFYPCKNEQFHETYEKVE